ncbi:HEPN domain-containing protein [Candidatus Calescamantes bacterium]|nr:HEPN domain-containing protein [Candidatus Calescamantes bacterium]
MKKAEDFYEAMLRSYKENNWNSVGLEGVHCAISAADALMVFYYGIRCASDDHRDSVKLLEQHFPEPEYKNYISHFRRIISQKNLVEYEDRNFSAKEAEEIVKKAERFLNWVKEKIR